ncbi:unnamed protein product [Phytomonas sp. Hart1]|nr:unnamed protein product [Phytomonas sp. Hart1]|eukprot:CCW70879.1 unnamed protein product [Phytomonas sp. isolate Hart1]
MLTRRRNRNTQDGAAHTTAFSDGSASTATAGSTSRLPLISSSRVDKKELSSMLEDLMVAFAPNVLPCLLCDHSCETNFGTSAGEAPAVDTSVSSQLPIRLTRAILFMYLHTCSGPPDYPRINPCTTLECWIDPLVAQGSRRAGGSCSEAIAEVLESQYRSVLREDIPISRVVEANIEVASMMLGKARNLTRDGRVLVHYNGHGMPRATDLGEVWVFDSDHTHYVPFNITDISDLIGTPTLYIFDCNAAGAILRHWQKNLLHEKRPHDLFICACDAHETLPLNPVLPADMLTSCLTTPLKMVLWWYIGYSHHKMLLPQVTEEMIRNLPGDLSDRRSPRGDLNWVLNAVTTTIAWCTLPPSQFHYLFRHDPRTRAIFRNAILADRLMRETGVIPITYPALAEEMHLHPMWELWDCVLERTIAQLPGLMAAPSTRPKATPGVRYQESSFFDDQLLAFEVWVHYGDMTQTPQQLPCVLFALTQVHHRVRAFTLLAKYLDSSLAAGRLATLCGILPYLSRLIAQVPEVLLIVTVVWMQVIRADPLEGCEEISRSKTESYFTSLLRLDEATTTIEMVEYGKRVDHTAEAARGNAALHEAEVDTSGQLLPQRVVFSPIEPALQPSSARAAGLASALRSPQASGKTAPSPHLTKGVTYYLMNDVSLPRSKSMVCYILYQYLLRGRDQCLLCWNHHLLNAAFPCLSHDDVELQSWACLVLSMLFRGLRHAKNFASRECASRLDLFSRHLRDRSPVVRSSCVTLIASVVGVRVDLLPPDQQVRRLQMEKSVIIKLRQILFDASMSVRGELIFFACQMIYVYRSVLPRMRVPGVEDLSIHEIEAYVRAVGKDSPRWELEEPGVQVHSLLNLNRPTLNAIFDDKIVFKTTVLTADDPVPTPEELDPALIVEEAMEILLGLVHDAAFMLWELYRNCDGAKVERALSKLSTGTAPESARFASEALRTMAHLPSLSSSYYFTEADRARARWNADMMRLLALDNSGRRLEPRPGSLSSPPSPPRGLKETATAGGGDGVIEVVEGGVSALLSGPTRPIRTLLGSGSRYQIFPSLVRSDMVICTAPRTLEMSFVMATRDQRVMYVSYEGYNTLTVQNSFVPRLAGPIHDLLVINDLSEHSGLLLVNKRGGFTLLKGVLERDATPTEAAVFTACLPPPSGAWIDLKTVYHGRTMTLFYGGAIGAGGMTEIHGFRVGEEQVTQRMVVPGNPTLSCLTAHTSQRALFAGFSDGVVRYYDDRRMQGGVSVVASLPAGEREREAVLGVGPIATAASTTFRIATMTSSALCVFDTRKLNTPTLRMGVRELLLGGEGEGKGKGPLSAPLPSISCGEVGLYTGLIGLGFSDGSYAAFNPKGQNLIEGRVRPSTCQTEGGAASNLFPRSLSSHPLRPLLTYGGDLMYFHL